MAEQAEINEIKREQDRLAQDQAETKSLIAQQNELSRELVLETRKTNEALGKVLVQLASNDKTVEYLVKEVDEIKSSQESMKSDITTTQKTIIPLSGMHEDWKTVKRFAIGIVVTAIMGTIIVSTY